MVLALVTAPGISQSSQENDDIQIGVIVRAFSWLATIVRHNQDQTSGKPPVSEARHNRHRIIHWRLSVWRDSPTTTPGRPALQSRTRRGRNQPAQSRRTTWWCATASVLDHRRRA